MVEVTMIGRVEFDLSAALEPRGNTVIWRDGFDGCARSRLATPRALSGAVN